MHLGRYSLALAVSALLASAGAVGCEPQEDGSDASAPVASPAPKKSAAAKRERVERKVAWPAEDQLDRAALKALSPKARAAVARSPLPVLVVDRPALLGASVIMSKKAWFALSTRDDGVSVSLHATQVAHRYPNTPRARGDRKVRGQHAFVTQNEGIWSASWIEGGVAYSLEVECNQLPDPRCEDEAFVMSLAADLSYVGGAGAGGTP